MTGKRGRGRIYLFAQNDLSSTALNPESTVVSSTIDRKTESTATSRLNRRNADASPTLIRRLRDPRSAVLILMAGVLLIGGGRKLLKARSARRAVVLLEDPDVSPETIRSVTEFGRAGLYDLFRIFGTAGKPAQRSAAGKAIAQLWADDQLVAEEEQAFTRRAYQVDWHARRRYPRQIRGQIPISVSYGLPILTKKSPGISPENLEWSHRIVGAGRANLEERTPWKSGQCKSEFSIIADDFESNGPHQIVLETKVRTVGLTGPWEIELPKMPFRFEFDPNLLVTSLLAQPDDSRKQTIEGAIRLESSARKEEQPARLLPIHEELVIRNLPWLVVDTPLPCDLAHRIEVEIEGLDQKCQAGRVILCGQGSKLDISLAESERCTRRFAIGPILGLDPSKVERPGIRRIRVTLTADPNLGWGEPDIRSIWPGTIESAWVEVELSRR